MIFPLAKFAVSPISTVQKIAFFIQLLNRYTHKKWIASIAITCEDKKTAIAVRDWLVNARDASGI